MGRYVYGPVPSRRLGRSLGVDLVPFKTCTYDCVYCQLGHTTALTARRQAWIESGAVLEEIRAHLPSCPDYITLSGSGEPTLCTGLGELIHGIKAMTHVPVAVLTNGSLLWRADVREELRQADLVIPSLDAGDDRHFRYVNRPHEAIRFAQMVEGLVTFGREFAGRCELEVLLLAGVTSTESEVAKIAEWARRIAPDRVYLNTVTRPPAETYAEPVPHAQMTRLAHLFTPPAVVIADYAGSLCETACAVSDEQILDMLRRRPCSVEDVAGGLGLHPNEVLKRLDDLVRQHRIERIPPALGTFYRAVHP